MDNAIIVDSLNFGYSRELVLKEISFSVEKGQFISIIGPNGSGKSTLLKNLANIYSPINGKIDIDGRNIIDYKKKELAKKIALVPQDTTISYGFSVFDIVLMGRFPYIGRFEKESEADYEMVVEALKLTNTFHLRDRSINEISGGERQRVIIARALVQEPDIIFLDEPTSHLDINHQIDLLTLLRKLNRERNTTIILVIHDINLACRYSDQILLMDKGEILSFGKPTDVITRENIEDSYGLNVIIEQNPYTDSLYIVPLSLKNRNSIKKPKVKIHVIAGGGSGGEILSKLEEKGFDVSLGVINVGDSDWHLAKKLSLKTVDEIPFSEISEESYKKNLEYISKSDIIILTSTAYGNGNLKNLQSAYEALKIGKAVYLVDNYRSDNEFDYTGGIALSILDKMKNKGLFIVNSVDEIIEKVF
ncbi:ABC transporter ATP-binding protein [Anaerosalibacter sp. Marseille-P3206]|uniref:ABC transporter ATP-binding protein n=1 Tax=Anaerosalibacter sp. Marseille-P3206 TaxID=1871005 RepID=UPI000987C8BD|nr:ABC transporter ATP-binding protein [Anaerosalibacter sp. Marseille-P3206]